MHPILNQWQTALANVGIHGQRLEILMAPRKVARIGNVWRVAFHEYGDVIHVHSHRPTRIALACIGDVRLGALIPAENGQAAEYFEVACGQLDQPTPPPDGFAIAEQPHASGPDVDFSMLQHDQTNGIAMVRDLLASMEANHA